MAFPAGFRPDGTPLFSQNLHKDENHAKTFQKVLDKPSAREYTNYIALGELAEWSKAHDWKSCVG